MNYQAILKEYWGYDDFRGIQREIIDSIASGRDTLGLMPTGGGKSITFQVPALAMKGVCIVVTPLIALMKDQVQHLRSKGIRATAIYGSMPQHEIIVALENCIFGGVKILYVSPERLASEIFRTKLRHMNVSFITVDEAHCISQWGYDFRPSYLKIADLRSIIGEDKPVLALTATATPQVIDDILDKLLFSERNVIKMSFKRENLAYVVRTTNDKYHEMLHILNAVPGSAIVYARSRRRTKEIADFINTHLTPHYEHPKSDARDDTPKVATYYHAGLDNSVRNDRQEAWQNDKVRIIVATNAFGMGIDKPDVRSVIHVDCPSSIEAYFQEAGRAGRDGKKSYAVLLYNAKDRTSLERRISDLFPDKEYIVRVYECLASYYQMAVGDGYGVIREFDIDRFCRTYHFFPIQVDSALKLLAQAGYINYDTDPDNSSRVMFILTRSDLYQLNDLTRAENAVVTALLRNYGSLFTDYTYINLNTIASHSGLTQEQTYLTLKVLSQKQILHFIPQRKMPAITYTQRREDSSRLVIPKSIYEDRRALFEKRVRSVWHYAENNEVCRSVELLRYFGEQDDGPCGQCDVCLQKTPDSNSLSRAEIRIMNMLSDGKRHSVVELQELQLPTEVLNNAIKKLSEEEMLTVEGSYILKTT